MRHKPAPGTLPILTGHVEAENVTKDQRTDLQCLEFSFVWETSLSCFHLVLVCPGFSMFLVFPNELLGDLGRSKKTLMPLMPFSQAAKTRRLVAINRSEIKLSPATTMTSAVSNPQSCTVLRLQSHRQPTSKDIQSVRSVLMTPSCVEDMHLEAIRLLGLSDGRFFLSQPAICCQETR